MPPKQPKQPKQPKPEPAAESETRTVMLYKDLDVDTWQTFNASCDAGPTPGEIQSIAEASDTEFVLLVTIPRKRPAAPILHVYLT